MKIFYSFPSRCLSSTREYTFILGLFYTPLLKDSHQRTTVKTFLCFIAVNAHAPNLIPFTIFELSFFSLLTRKVKSESHSVVFDSLRPHGCIVDETLQARILEWVAFPFSRGSSQPRDWTQVSHVAGGFFTSWATGEAQEYWSG